MFPTWKASKVRLCECLINTEKRSRPLSGSTPWSQKLSCEWITCPFHNKITQNEASNWEGKDNCESKYKINEQADKD